MIHLKILIPVGTAIIIVADVKYARVSTSIPTVDVGIYDELIQQILKRSAYHSLSSCLVISHAKSRKRSPEIRAIASAC